VTVALEPVRRAAVEASLGHYPAIFAILDCVEFGLPQSFEGAIRSEMTSFSNLILRPEPRAMIQTMFLGRVDFERLERKHELPEVAQAATALVKAEVEKASGATAALAAAGFAGLGKAVPLRDRQQPGYWIEGDDEPARAALAVLRRIHDAAQHLAAGQSEEALRVADYAAVTQSGFPAYLGGPFAFRSGSWK
jgi:3-hydroxyacyl-CoA dehydrogenase/enoyl-CoA hydratase/3-hydroxybutyryl-CoA epimerase